MTGKKSLKYKENKSHGSAFYAGGKQQHAPEKVEETEHLDQHAYSWPFEEDEEYPAKEAGRPAQLVFAREKVERFLRADDEEEAA